MRSIGAAVRGRQAFGAVARMMIVAVASGLGEHDKDKRQDRRDKNAPICQWHRNRLPII
jgi:hypothetical protein